MPQTFVSALGVSRTLLRAYWVFNLLLVIILLAGLPSTFVFEPALRDYYGSRPLMDAERIIPALRIAMALGLPMLAAIQVLVSRLLAIVETVRVGEPFVAANAARMRTIAWCLLAVQVIGMAFGIIAEMLRAGGADVDRGDVSLTGWIAVVLLFVLARIFEEGTRIRSDLEAMI